VRYRFAALLVDLAVIAVACGGHSRPSTDRALSKPVAAAATSTTTVSPRATVAATVSSTSSPSPASHGASPAKVALDAYLNALARLDEAAVTQSAGPASALAHLRLLVADVNKGQGGTTSVSLADDSFDAGSGDDSHVVFNGSAHLVSKVSGSKGDNSSTDAITGPVDVLHRDGVWRVSTFTYDDHPMVFVPEQASADEQGLQLSVAYVLSYGTATAAVVAVSANTEHAVTAMKSAFLTTAAGRSDNGRSYFTTDEHPVGFITWPRTDARPTHLDATFLRQGQAPTTFSIALTGSPSAS